MNEEGDAGGGGGGAVAMLKEASAGRKKRRKGRLTQKDAVDGKMVPTFKQRCQPWVQSEKGFSARKSWQMMERKYTGKVFVSYFFFPLRSVGRGNWTHSSFQETFLQEKVAVFHNSGWKTITQK